MKLSNYDVENFHGIKGATISTISCVFTIFLFFVWGKIIKDAGIWLSVPWGLFTVFVIACDVIFIKATISATRIKNKCIQLEFKYEEN